MAPSSQTRWNPRLLRLLIGGAILALIGAACSPGDTGADSLRIVATTTVWGDVVHQIVGDDAAVEVLMPIGVDPHDYQASSRQVATMASADLIVANGLGLEGGLADVLDAAANDGVDVLEIGPNVDPQPLSQSDEASSCLDAGSGSSEAHSCDPHVWMDPARVAIAARLIGDRLGSIDPSIDWRSRAATYAATVEAADDSIRATLEPIPAAQRKLVTNHDALGYFATAYDFAVVGTVIPGGSTLGNPSSAELADLVATMRAEQVSVIFAETTEPSVLAETLAEELGEDVTVVELFTGSLGPPGSGAETLIGLLVTDAERIAAALR